MPLYSHSRLGSFEDCPRQYLYEYIGQSGVEEAESIEGGIEIHQVAVEKLIEEAILDGAQWPARGSGRRRLGRLGAGSVLIFRCWRVGTFHGGSITTGAWNAGSL
jgi:hypothetical protein